jgi:hypothetical protein
MFIPHLHFFHWGLEATNVEQYSMKLEEKGDTSRHPPGGKQSLPTSNFALYMKLSKSLTALGSPSSAKCELLMVYM